MRPGLKAITDLAGVSLETLTEETISFTFAPRLNALGRLGDANPAVELLLTQDHSRARILATQIEGLNAQRRLLTSQVYDAAEALLRSDPGLLKEPAIVLSHPGWPGGVVGIVANKLVERHHKPAILLTKSEDGILRGSARSLEGLNITQAIATQKGLLFNFGGHPMAAGLSLPNEKLGEFRRGLGKAIEAQLGQIAHAEPVLEIDAWVKLEEVDFKLAEALESMAPFGAGNPPLTLATHRVTLKAAREIGKNREHLRLNIEDEKGNTQSLLWWGGAGETLPEEGSKIDAAWSLRPGSYRGQKQVTLNFIDYRIVEEPPLVLRPRDIDIIDHRLQGRLESIDPGALIWSEGTDRDKGKNRFELIPSDVFVIYTAPPSPTELHQAMDIVKPRQVHVFAIPSDWDEPDSFLIRLAGLCKYAINQRAGKVTLPDLCAATAARQRAVEVGLQWLAASGQLNLTVELNQVTLSREKTDRNPFLQEELLVALRGILNETSAYRKFFKTAENIRSLL
jgi:single-stranded-DNA-specific exonuclease